MRKKPGAEENFTTRPGAAAPWRLSAVRALPQFRLAVQFVDGTYGEVDMSKLISSPGAGVFAPLRDALVFARVSIQHGAASWPGDIDLAPDAMYDAIEANGSWTPEG